MTLSAPAAATEDLARQAWDAALRALVLREARVAERCPTHSDQAERIFGTPPAGLFALRLDEFHRLVRRALAENCRLSAVERRRRARAPASALPRARR